MLRNYRNPTLTNDTTRYLKSFSAGENIFTEHSIIHRLIPLKGAESF